MARKKQNKKAWGIAFVCLWAVLIVCVVNTPTSDQEDIVSELTETPVETSSKPTETPKAKSKKKTTNEEKTEAEEFAEENNVSVKLAESLETVLTGMELTDSSRVGIFHYDLSNVYNWKQIEDWADGKRYSAWMDMEHIWYIYVTDNTVVGVRDGHGNIYY